MGGNEMKKKSKTAELIEKIGKEIGMPPNGDFFYELYIFKMGNRKILGEGITEEITDIIQLHKKGIHVPDLLKGLLRNIKFAKEMEKDEKEMDIKRNKEMRKIERELMGLR